MAKYTHSKSTPAFYGRKERASTCSWLLCWLALVIRPSLVTTAVMPRERRQTINRLSPPRAGSPPGTSSDQSVVPKPSHKRRMLLIRSGAKHSPFLPPPLSKGSALLLRPLLLPPARKLGSFLIRERQAPRSVPVLAGVFYLVVRGCEIEPQTQLWPGLFVNRSA